MSQEGNDFVMKSAIEIKKEVEEDPDLMIIEMQMVRDISHNDISGKSDFLVRYTDGTESWVPITSIQNGDRHPLVRDFRDRCPRKYKHRRKKDHSSSLYIRIMERIAERKRRNDKQLKKFPNGKYSWRDFEKKLKKETTLLWMKPKQLEKLYLTKPKRGPGRKPKGQFLEENVEDVESDNEDEEEEEEEDEEYNGYDFNTKQDVESDH